MRANCAQMLRIFALSNTKAALFKGSACVFLVGLTLAAYFFQSELFAIPRGSPQVHEVHINSSAEEKREILKSFLFEILNDLYPHGASSKSQPSDKRLRKIETDYQSELDTDVDVAKRYASSVRAYFAQELELQNIPTLKISRTGIATAQTDSRHITIDVELLKVNLAAGVSDAKVLTVTPADRDKLISDLFELKKSIKSAPSGHWTVQLDDENDENSLLNLEDKMTHFRDAYSQAVSFVIGHELGHKILGHLNRGCECSKTVEHELSADRFAMFIIGLHEGEVIQKLRRENFPANPSDTSPSGVFFERSYRLAGFEGVSGCGCEYPAVAERIRVANEPFDAGYKIGFESPPGVGRIADRPAPH